MLVGFVTHRGNFRDDFFINEICDLLFQRRAIHVERNFRNDELLAIALHLLQANASAQLEAALAGGEIIFDTFNAAEKSAGRKIRALDKLHQFGNRNLRLVNLRANAIHDFAEIVRCHVRRHADRDARAAVDQQIRKRRREHFRLGETLVVVRDEIHRVLVHVLHQRRAEMRQTRLGITHRRRRIVFDGTEVAFAIHQLLAHRPRLGHMHERRVNHRFAVRMVIARSIAADLGAFVRLASGKQRQFVHRVKNTSLRRLQSVAHIGQRARNDHGHRVVEERVLDLIGDVDLGNLFALRVGAAAGLLFRLLRWNWWCGFGFVWHDTDSGKIISVKSNVEIADVQRVIHNEIAARLNLFAHQSDKHFFGFHGVG